MSTIKRFRIVLMGVAAIALALLLTREQKEPVPKRYPFEPPRPTEGTVPAALQDELLKDQGQGVPGGTSAEVSLEDISDGRVSATQEQGDEDPGEEPAEDEMPLVDLEEARAEAEAEVRLYEEDLARTLWTYNPNARKARLKAAELSDRADDIEQWVQTQDSRADWSPEEKKQWDAQRDVWLDHVAEMREVSQKLSKSRGTRRKVRNIAQEMKSRLEGDGS